MSTRDKSMKALSVEPLVAVAAEDKGILVAVRIRPLSNDEIDAGAQKCCEVFDNSNIVTISQAGVVGSYLKSQAGTVNEYAFDAVFDSSASQMVVYEKTAKPFIPKVLAGFNVTVFAYGATSAGKTHTMFGSSRADKAASHAEAGIIPNAIMDVFELLRVKARNLSVGEKWEVNLSYIEVYNEQIYDLLVPVPNGKVLSLREDQEKGLMVIAGVIESRVDSLDEVLKLLELGNRNRKTEATMANQVSSRSHAILQLNICHKFRLNNGRDSMVESKLSLIDLAGSERASATLNRGARLMEGANINKSLLALANCINALAENSGTGKKNNVKYRDSKLTLLLKNSLEGKSNLVIIANINPSHTTLEDSHNTLKYANRAKNIKVNPILKEIIIDSTWAEREIRLKAENVLLKQRIIFLEQVIEDLQSSSSTSIDISTTSICRSTTGYDENRTLPMWNRSSRVRSVKNKGTWNLKNDNQNQNEDEDEETEDGDRMSQSFSSTLSSYSDMGADMIDYPFGEEYEASLAASHDAENHGWHMTHPPLKTNNNLTNHRRSRGSIGHDKDIALQSSSSSSSSSFSSVEMTFEVLDLHGNKNTDKNKTVIESEMFSSLLTSVGSQSAQVHGPIRRQSFGKRGRADAFNEELIVKKEVEVEEPTKCFVDLNSSVCTYTTASSAPTRPSNAGPQLELHSQVNLVVDPPVYVDTVSLSGNTDMSELNEMNEVMQIDENHGGKEEEKKEVYVTITKKRRISAIPMFARSSCRIKENTVRMSDASGFKSDLIDLPLQIDFPEDQSTRTEAVFHERSSSSINVGIKKLNNDISLPQKIVHNIPKNDENVLGYSLPVTDPLPLPVHDDISSSEINASCVSSRNCRLGSRRRSVGIAAVTAMLAAMPENLKPMKRENSNLKLKINILDESPLNVTKVYDDKNNCNVSIIQIKKNDKNIVMKDLKYDNKNCENLFCIGESSNENVIGAEVGAVVGKKVLGPRRMSMRVKQSTSAIKILCNSSSCNENKCHDKFKNENDIRGTIIINSENDSRSNSNNNSRNNTPNSGIINRLSARDDKKSITRRKSYIKPSTGTGKGGGGVALLHSLYEEDESALLSDAWLAI